jgi:hypothetical protein
LKPLDTNSLTAKVKDLKDINSIFNLFESLGYKDYIFDRTYTWDKKRLGFKKEILSNIKNFYSILNIEKRLYVFFIEAENNSKIFFKDISKNLIDSYIRVLIISTDNWKNFHFILPQYEKKEGTRKLKLSTLHLDTEQIYHTDLEIISKLHIKPELNFRDIWRDCWQFAFSKEKVNEEFYKDFQNVFFNFRKYVFDQCEDIKISHEFTQQTLNRIMFLYFIAKKGWLNSDQRFITNFYKNYKIDRNNNNTPPDSFYENWMSILFFEVFNKSFPNFGIAKYLLEELKNKMIFFPYLNGGLFKREDFDKYNITISDKKFDAIFSFLDKYNFTIKEDLPLDVQVAVDPQMLGYLYESFANVAEEIYERNDLGVFYTSTIEVDLMVQRSLVEYLLNHLSKEKVPHHIIYRFIFDDDKTEAIEYFGKNKLWNIISELLNDIKVVDPACGSGAFLLGYLKILVELTGITDKHLGYSRSDFDLKKDIIGKNLFGVDIMKWALHCAELRLWLSMIVEEDLPQDRRKEPLLPNFNLRLRVGDSLVQKIGNINFNLDDISISFDTRRRLDSLRIEKEKFYRNDPSAKFKNPEAVQNEENRIFWEILEEEKIKIDKEIQILNINLKQTNQLTFYGETNVDKNQKEKIKKELENLKQQKIDITDIASELRAKGKQFVIWEIDFVDVFQDKKGFDVVIGNPPYIRQEKISPPSKPKGEATDKERKKYKEDLIENIKIKYPFIKKVDKKCDYYIYFYLKGLSLLNPQGTFCFITSNSWLDVGYGKLLQEFLVKYTPIKAIYDNLAKRSFAHASVNTVIVLLGSPNLINKKDPTPTSLENIAKFVMFKEPFEEVISYKNMVTIHDFFIDTHNLFGNTYKGNDFRIYAISQRDLLLKRIGKKEKETKTFKNQNAGEYKGSKWGGKYLRAPDIFFTILEKGKDKLVRLGDIADVRFGIKTGANDFFYVEDVTEKIDFNNKKHQIKNLGIITFYDEIKNSNLRIVYNKSDDSFWLIEEEFLKPVIKSPRECKAISVRIENLKNKVFMCCKSKIDLKRTKATDYISWGETKKYHKRPTCASRKYWWNLGKVQISDLFCMMSMNDRHIWWLNKKSLVDARLYDIFLRDKERQELTLFSLNSTLTPLFVELNARANLGDGALDFKVYEANEILVLKSNIYIKKENLTSLLNREIKNIFYEIGFDYKQPIREQEPRPLQDRKAVDDAVFDVLGLTDNERKEVYWATAELVKNRLDKARSFKNK